MTADKKSLCSFDELQTAYLRMTEPAPLVETFRRAATRRNIKTDTEGFFWLYYASLLLGVGDVEGAKGILTSYHIGLHGLGGIARFPALSILAEELGIADDAVSKSAAICRALDNGVRSRQFESMVKGRRIAIVGNGPSAVGKGQGAEIDDHDLVLRFNNYVVKGFGNDYGLRTDIWIRGFGGCDVDDLSACGRYRYVGISGNYRYLPFCSDGQVGILYRDLIERRIEGGYFDPCGYLRMQRLFSGQPTTGLAAIYSCLRFGAESVDCYGFSFLEDKPSYEHYFNDQDKEAVRHGLTVVHNVDSEREFLLRLTRDMRWARGHWPRWMRMFLRPGSVWRRFNPKIGKYERKV